MGNDGMAEEEKYILQLYTCINFIYIHIYILILE